MALAGGPRVLWTKNVGMNYANVVFSGDRLFTVGLAEDSSLLCLNAGTGEELWRFRFSTLSECQATPCTDGRSVYALDKSGELVCVSEKNGDLRWRRNIRKDFGAERLVYGYAQSPVLAGDLLILNVNTSGMAVNKKSGELVWASKPHTVKLAEGYYATPVVYETDGSTRALLFSGTGLFSVDVRTGDVFWFHEWIDLQFKTVSSQANVADPIVCEDRVFIGSNNGLEKCALLDVSGDKPRVVWENQNLRTGVSSSVLVDGYLYGNNGQAGRPNTLRCLEWRSGKVMWEEEAHLATVTAAGDKLVVLEERGDLHIIEATPSAYTEISSCRLPVETGIHRWWSPPVLYRGRIYCRDWAGDLVCIDMRK
jgi:outer membrane protein assembly factor BamB